MNSSTLKGGLVGAGYFAQFQAEAWNRLPAADIAAVADLDLEKARAFARQFHIPRAYASVEEMLEGEKPDFIDIATRPESHLDLVRAAARRRVHVFCQKPMAPTWEECVAMCQACEAAGVRLLIHENWRWQPWFREIKRLLDSDALGRLFQVSFFWRTGDGRGPEPYAHQPYFRQMPRLLIYETLVHILDTYRFLVGEVETLACQIARVNPAIIGEDQALIQLRFRVPVLGLIDGNRIGGPMPPPIAMGSLLLECDRSTLRMSPDGRLWIAEHGQTELAHQYSIPAEGYKGDSVRATQAHLIDCLRSGASCESEGRQYLQTVALVEACYRSAAAGQPVAPASCPAGSSP